MSIRFDDEQRIVELSVRDLVDAGAPTGHLVAGLAATSRARLAAGQRVHTDYQGDRAADDPHFRAEVTLRRQLAVGAWTAVLHGRADGVSEEGGIAVVEEIKSTALDSDRLFATNPGDWPGYVAQLEIYLWLLATPGTPDPLGRLVFVSLLDGSRHVLGIVLDHDAVDARVRLLLDHVVTAREARLAWLAQRRGRVVPVPFDDWRPGQERIVAATRKALDRGRPALVEAPTGLGKTAAVLHAVLSHALSHDAQVFWATARTTQQGVALATLQRLRRAGLPLRVVTIVAKEKTCLNDVVACRPDRCPFAEDYYDKVQQTDAVAKAVAVADEGPEALRALAETLRVCPYELSLDASEQADVVVGDYNYAFDPAVHLRRHFDREPERWVVVVDEAHQLVDRARGYGSPRVLASEVRTALTWLSDRDDVRVEPFIELARHLLDAIDDAEHQIVGPSRDGVSVAELSPAPWRDLSDRIDELALDWARLVAEWGGVDEDPWLDAARAVLRFAGALQTADDATVHLVGGRGLGAFVGLLCLDPSGWLGPRIARLGGFVGCSATLTPTAFYRDLLGLDPDQLEICRIGAVFPPENRKVIVAPRVSTTFRDREAHAEPTARLMARCIEAVPGNVAAYFPSFAMLRDISARWSLEDRELLVQEPSMPESRRQDWLARMAEPGPPVVLGAVLGGIFAEGIDLPPGALHAVLIAGPALPPVGLERDLLRDTYERRYGEGFRYASLVPGMTRVVQAAGRLVRSEEDRGVVVLIGRRFRWRDIASLLPEAWVVEVPDDPAAAIADFWGAP